MSYDRDLLLETILNCLRDSPHLSLSELSIELRVSKRTIEKTIRTSRKMTYKNLQMEIILTAVRRALELHPTTSIKELSYAVGFKSPRSFARAVRRVCGLCPTDLRAEVAFGRPRAI